MLQACSTLLAACGLADGGHHGRSTLARRPSTSFACGLAAGHSVALARDRMPARGRTGRLLRRLRRRNDPRTHPGHHEGLAHRDVWCRRSDLLLPAVLAASKPVAAFRAVRAGTLLRLLEQVLCLANHQLPALCPSRS